MPVKYTPLPPLFANIFAKLALPVKSRASHGQPVSFALQFMSVRDDFRDPSKESQVKAAESCLKLGEVSLESEQYEQAIADLQLCLTTQKEHLEPCDRAIAETYPYFIHVFGHQKVD